MWTDFNVWVYPYTGKVAVSFLFYSLIQFIHLKGYWPTSKIRQWFCKSNLLQSSATGRRVPTAPVKIREVFAVLEKAWNFVILVCRESWKKINVLTLFLFCVCMGGGWVLQSYVRSRFTVQRLEKYNILCMKWLRKEDCTFAYCEECRFFCKYWFQRNLLKNQEKSWNSFSSEKFRNTGYIVLFNI